MKWFCCYSQGKVSQRQLLPLRMECHPQLHMFILTAYITVVIATHFTVQYFGGIVSICDSLIYEHSVLATYVSLFFVFFLLPSLLQCTCFILLLRMQHLLYKCKKKKWFPASFSSFTVRRRDVKKHVLNLLIFKAAFLNISYVVNICT